MVGSRRRTSRGSGRGRSRGRGEEQEREERLRLEGFEDHEITPNISQRGKASTSSLPRQIIRILDDSDMFTTPEGHRSGLLVRRIEGTNNTDDPGDRHTDESTSATECTRTSRRYLNPIHPALNLPDENLSGSNSRSAFNNSTLQATGAMMSRSDESNRTVSVDECFDQALVTGVTLPQTSVQPQAVTTSLTGAQELHILEENLDPLVSNLYGTLVTVCDLPCSPAPTTIMSTSRGEGNVVLGNQSNNSDDSTTSFIRRHINLSIPTTVPGSTFPGSTSAHPEATMNGNFTSLNETEVAEQMASGDIFEVESSVGACTSKVSVSSYKVKPHYVTLLTVILSKYGDIGANCVGSVTSRSMFMELVCDIIENLKKSDLKIITQKELQCMIASVSDIEKDGVQVGWLKKRLDDIYEAKKSIAVIKSSSTLKRQHAECKFKAQEIKERLEIHKNMALDIQKKINSDEAELSAIQTEVSEFENMISEKKAKFRHVYKLGSLVQDLVDI